MEPILSMSTAFHPEGSPSLGGGGNHIDKSPPTIIPHLYNQVTDIFNNLYLLSSLKTFLCPVLLMLLHNCSWLGQSHSTQGMQKEKGRYQSLTPKDSSTRSFSSC